MKNGDDLTPLSLAPAESEDTYPPDQWDLGERDLPDETEFMNAATLAGDGQFHGGDSDRLTLGPWLRYLGVTFLGKA